LCIGSVACDYFSSVALILTNVKINVKKTVIGDKMAYLKQQKFDVSVDFHALFHHGKT